MLSATRRAQHLRVAEVGPSLGRRAGRRAAGEQAGRLAAPPCAQGGGSRQRPQGRHAPRVPDRAGRTARVRDYFDDFWSEALDRFREAARKETRMSTMTTEAIRKTVLVDFAPAEAFELFTTRVSPWWPTETHSYAHDKVTDVIFEPRVGRPAVRGDRRGHSRVGEDHGLGAAAPPRAGVADRQGLRHRGRSPLLAQRARDRESSSNIEAGNASQTRPMSTRATATAGTPCSRLRRDSEGARRRRRPAPRAGRRAEARRRSSGSRLGANSSSQAASSAGVHHRMPVTYSDASCSAVNAGAGSKAGVRSRKYRSTCPSH